MMELEVSGDRRNERTAKRSSLKRHSSDSVRR
jgi:hypothetical protein